MSFLDENWTRLSSIDLQEHVGLIKKEILQMLGNASGNSNGVQSKTHLLNYIGSTCLDQSNGGTFADALISREVHKDLLTLVKSNPTIDL